MADLALPVPLYGQVQLAASEPSGPTGPDTATSPVTGPGSARTEHADVTDETDRGGFDVATDDPT